MAITKYLNCLARGDRGAYIHERHVLRSEGEGFRANGECRWCVTATFPGRVLQGGLGMPFEGRSSCRCTSLSWKFRHYRGVSVRIDVRRSRQYALTLPAGPPGFFSLCNESHEPAKLSRSTCFFLTFSQKPYQEES